MDNTGSGVTAERAADDGGPGAGALGAGRAEPSGTTLTSVRKGGRGTVVGLDPSTPQAVARRLRDLGFRANTPVEVIRCAPLGSPTLYRVGESDICLRRTEAARIRVKVER